MKNIYEQPELNKMAYEVEAFASESGEESTIVKNHNENPIELLW